jgi:hypothetical protein
LERGADMAAIGRVLLYCAEAAHGWSCWSGRGTQPLLLTTEKMIDVGLGKREELTIKLAVRDCHG